MENKQSKTILIYGDSLPWGAIPGTTTFERYPYSVRWPGKLQALLGDSYQVIEECLCARTIDSDDQRPGFEGRNGLTYLVPCLDSHDPIDIVIVSLGLNELKGIFSWTPEQVAEKMKTLLLTIKSRKPNFHEVKPRVVLISPPVVREKDTGNWGDLWIGSGQKSKEVGPLFEKLAKELNIDFIDSSKIVITGKDGVHINKEAHEKIAKAIAKKVLGKNK